MVVCNSVVLTAQAYAAMTNGTCTPACSPSVPCQQVHTTCLWLQLAAVTLPEEAFLNRQAHDIIQNAPLCSKLSLSTSLAQIAAISNVVLASNARQGDE